MKRKSHYESGKQSLNDTAENSSFNPKLADRIARRLSWLWGWQQALELSYAQSALKSLVNGWLGIPTVPAMAYVYVEDITYWSHMGK
jgi:hypothetical protein